MSPKGVLCTCVLVAVLCKFSEGTIVQADDDFCEGITGAGAKTVLMSADPGDYIGVGTIVLPARRGRACPSAPALSDQQAVLQGKPYICSPTCNQRKTSRRGIARYTWQSNDVRKNYCHNSQSTDYACLLERCGGHTPGPAGACCCLWNQWLQSAGLHE